MKKLLIVIVLLLGITTINAQTYYGNAYSYNLDYGYGYEGWKSCNLDVKIQNQRLIVYSNDKQIFDITKVISSYDTEKYNYLSAICTDTNYTNCGVEMYIYKSGIIVLKITYTDIIYKYKIKITGYE